MMENNLIVVKQLPVIEDQLRMVQESIEARVRDALALPCTEATRTAVKKERAALKKEFDMLEERRKAVKRSILEPYERFEGIYRRCAADIYRQADAELKSRIDAVESGLRQEKEEALRAWFEEYRDFLGLDGTFCLTRSGVRVTLSESKKSLQDRAKAFLDRVAGDIQMIDTLEDRDEILAEYRTSLDVSAAVTAVKLRHKAAGDERVAREAREARQAEMDAAAEKAEQAYLYPPVMVPPPEKDPDEVIPRLTFTAVGATRRQLRNLKEFLNQEGIRYE